MLKLFTVLYVVCSVYTSTPEIDPEIAVKCITSEEPSAEIAELVRLPEVDEALKGLGYFRDEAGVDELLFRNAVLRFQSDHNMIVNGGWDEDSAAVLRERLLDRDFSFTDKVASVPSKQYWITVNKTKRILTLYKSDTVAAKYPVAIGKPASLTPEGKFTIANRIKNPAWGGGGYAKPVQGGSPQNPLGYRWLGLSIKGGGQYGIHGNNNPYSIGLDVSLGCIRMINHDVEELFELVSTSIPVWVGSEKLLSEWGVRQDTYKAGT